MVTQFRSLQVGGTHNVELLVPASDVPVNGGGSHGRVAAASTGFSLWAFVTARVANFLLYIDMPVWELSRTWFKVVATARVFEL